MSEKEERWFKVVEFFDERKGKVVEHEGHQIYLCGEIGEVTIIQVAEVYGNDAATVARLRAAKEVMTTLGIEKGLVVTDSVKFMKLREISEEELKNKLDMDSKVTIQ